MGLYVTIMKLLDSTKPKHSNTQILDWDLFAQLEIGFKFLNLPYFNIVILNL
jgi:hypothetical protein